MRNELKRLIMGFIYSLMTVSFIMSPIPFIGFNNAYAEGLNTERSKIYKKGENVDEIKQTTQLKNYTDEQGGFAAMINQAVTGLMAVTLLKSLRFNYLHKFRPEMYGNDCPKNKYANYTMRIAQFGALMYLIGDISANLKFSKAAQTAADEMEDGALKDWDPKEKTNFDNMSDEEKAAYEEQNGDGSADKLKETNQQVAGFNKLLDILNGQKDAVETKIKMAKLTKLAYTLSTALEAIGIFVCKGSCAKNRTSHMAIKGTKFTSLNSTAIATATTVGTASAVCPGPCLAQAAAACTTLATSLGTLAGQYAAYNGEAVAQATEEEVSSEVESNTEKTFWGGMLAGIGGWFTPIFNGEEGADQAASTAIEQMPDTETIADARRAQEAAAEQARIAGSIGTETASITSIVTQAKICGTGIGGPLAELQVKSALLAYIDYIVTPVECCGGDGHPTGLNETRRGLLEGLLAPVSTLTGLDDPKLRTDAMQAQIAEIKAQTTDQAGKQALDQAQNQLMNMLGPSINILGMDIGNLNMLVSGGEAQQMMNNVNVGSVASGLTRPGTMLSLGVPVSGQVHNKKDIRVFGLFEDSNASGEFMKEEYPGQFRDTKEYVVNNFESMLRKHAMDLQLNQEFNDPREEIAFVAEKESEIKNILFFYRQMVHESSMQELAMEDYKKHRYWNTIMSMVENMLMPKAHAFLSGLGGGGAMTGVAIGVGCQLVKGFVSGPFAQVLNLGCQFMMMNAMLGKIAKNWAFVKPLNRTISWGVLLGVTVLVGTWDKKAKEKIEERIKAIEEERAKWIASNARSGIGAGEGYQAGQYQANSYQANAQNSGESFIKQCAVPAGNTFKPVGCPQSTTKSAFEIEKPDKVTAKMLGPQGLKGMSTLSNLTSKTANGTLSDNDLSDSNLDAIDNLQRAIASRAQKTMDAVDHLNKRLNKSKKVKPVELKSSIAGIVNGMGQPKGAISGSLSSIGSGSPNIVTSKKPKDDGNGVVTASGNKAGGSAGGAATPAAGGFNLDLLGDEFGDDSAAGGDGSADGATAAKAEENLNDFEINHDDINKKKEVSIFKILSNRYILSYPKVLEEEVVGAPDAKGEPEAKVDLEKQLEEMKQ